MVQVFWLQSILAATYGNFAYALECTLRLSFRGRESYLIRIYYMGGRHGCRTVPPQLCMHLCGSTLFTNGVEWLGREFRLSESVVGCVLAAVGTALP
jgi:hypothetical protein